MGGARGRPWTCLSLVATSGAVFVALLMVSSSPPILVPPVRTTPDVRPAASPELEIDPTTWWMPAGNATVFGAAWVGPPPGCGMSAVWFRWSVVGASAEGVLNSTTGPNATFAASSVLSGTTTLRVRSALEVTCGSGSSVMVGSAEANVTVIAPISIENLSLSPDPITAGGTAYLHGNLSGGAPPYILRVFWSAESASVVQIPGSGTFSLLHAFPAGQYLPSVIVTDSEGLVAAATVGEPLTASDTLAVGIVASSTVTDVGVPVSFHATVIDEPVGAVTGWSCGPVGSSPSPGENSSTNFSCGFSEVGTGSVLFEALPQVPLPPVSVVQQVTVVPRPTLVVLSPNLTAEVGQPCTATVDIVGGVPPFRLDWTEVGSSTNGTLPVAADGHVILPFTPAQAGSLELVVRAADADRAMTLISTVRLVVDPALNASAAPSRLAEPWGTELSLTGSVTAGVPPFLWVVTPGSLPLNESGTSGSLSSPGSFVWQGAYSAEGSVEVSMTLVDGAGGFVTCGFELPEVVPLSGTVSVSAGRSEPPGTFRVSLNLSGGLPPFQLNVSASDGTNGSRMLPTDGNSAWSFPSERGGILRVEVGVTDRLGVEREWNATVAVGYVPHLRPPPPPDEDSAPPLGSGPAPNLLDVLAAAFLAVGSVAIGLTLLRRRRAHRGPSPLPEPVLVLRQIIEPADGADRATVELLAEEAGIPLDLTHSTLDRLIAEGTVRSEADSEGEEVLSWSTQPLQ
jgi:hypothetical protein